MHNQLILADNLSALKELDLCVNLCYKEETERAYL